MSKTLAAVLVALALVAGAIGGYHLEKERGHQKRQALIGTVKAICDYSRGTISGEAEEACGLALDLNGLEYSCPSYESPTVLCKVTERK